MVREARAFLLGVAAGLSDSESDDISGSESSAPDLDDVDSRCLQDGGFSFFFLSTAMQFHLNLLNCFLSLHRSKG